jgi:adenylylsulfate kinase
MTEHKATNITWHEHVVSTAELEKLHGHKGTTIWFTGLPASGKSTVANAVAAALNGMKVSTFVLDGDNIRHGLNKNLGFSAADREENIRRIGEVATLFADAGTVCIVAFISPYRADRARARTAAGNRRFFEVYVRSALATCERRDPKGHYARARAGEIKNFTGVDAPYEPPEQPSIVIDTETRDIESCVAQLLEFVVAGCRT